MCDLDNYYKFIMNTPIDRIFISLLIIYFFILVNKYIICRILKLISKIAKKTSNRFDDNLLRAMTTPIKLLIIFIGICLALEYTNNGNIKDISIPSSKFIKTAMVIVIGLFLYNLTLKDSLLYCRIQKAGNSNKIVFPFIAIILRIIIIVMCISIIAREFGLAGFIAGLGISGLAFALAAQDTFSNLFGGMVIVIDKPFAIGDWVQTDNIEGIVEDITFRSSKIRTFSKALVTVPNSKLANTSIINWTQRNMRRIHFKFTISYESSIESIENIIIKIEEMISKNEKVEDELVIVSFNEFKSYGFSIFIYFYTNVIDYKGYERVKQEINLNILRILREYNIEFAYPMVNMNNLDTGESMELESIRNITDEERSL